MKLLLTALLMLPSVSYAGISCVADNGNTYPFESFSYYSAAKMFAESLGIEENIIKEEGKDIWRVYMIVPKESCAFMEDGF